MMGLVQTCERLGKVVGQQKMIVQWDLYAVHREKAFLEWVYEKYPFISFVFIPGGCTGICQVADTVVNR